MDAEPGKQSFLKHMLEAFGPLPGQSRLEFAAEVKALSQPDKDNFADMLTAAGYPCDVPPQHVVAS
jgi:hypothetical protein